ncbi:MAG: FixH family protein [Pseudomonadota bacterium]
MKTLRAPREFTGRHMLLIMFAFFGTVITVNIVMATLASSSWTGLLAKNGYVASIDYAKDRAARADAAARGWVISASAEGGHISIDALDGRGDALAVSEFVEAMPEDRRLKTRALTTAPSATGADASPVLGPGYWMLRFTVGEGEEALIWRTPITISP